MSALFQTVRAYFDDNDWPVDVHDELPIVRMSYEGEHGSWPVYTRVYDERDQVAVLCTLPDLVAPKARKAVAELLARANFDLPYGSWEMDFDDGEVRFRTSIDVSRAKLTDGLLDPMVRTGLSVVDEFLPSLQAVASGKLSPAKAIETRRGQTASTEPIAVAELWQQ